MTWPGKILAYWGRGDEQSEHVSLKFYYVDKFKLLSTLSLNPYCRKCKQLCCGNYFQDWVHDTKWSLDNSCTSGAVLLYVAFYVSVRIITYYYYIYVKREDLWQKSDRSRNGDHYMLIPYAIKIKIKCMRKKLYSLIITVSSYKTHWCQRMIIYIFTSSWL